MSIPLPGPLLCGRRIFPGAPFPLGEGVSDLHFLFGFHYVDLSFPPFSGFRVGWPIVKGNWIQSYGLKRGTLPPPGGLCPSYMLKVFDEALARLFLTGEVYS